MLKRTPQPPEFARAMKILRMKAGLSLKEIEAKVGVTRQAISRWENQTATFPEDRIDLYLKALGRDRSDLEKELGRINEEGVGYENAASSMVSGLSVYEVRDETMSPWVEPGEVVLYQPGRHPRRMEGCLVELVGGEMLVRLYMRERDGYVFLQRINPESVEQILHSKVKAIHKVAFRGN